MERATIQDQIDRILQSETFAGKGQLIKLLEVLSERMDSQATLKPDRVIKELWPEDCKAKDKTSADVATEINRLRKALETYYSGEGASDPILITLPNRSAPATNGQKEKRWIRAEPRGSSQKTLRFPRFLTGRRFILASLAAITVIAIITLALVPRFTASDPPQSARIDGSTLVVMNARGEELWRRGFPDGFTREYYEDGVTTRMWFGDLDGDGHTDVLFLHSPAGNWMAHPSTLICYSDRGKEKWRWHPGRDLPELNGNPPIFKTVALGVLKAPPGQPRRIVVSSIHLPYYPTQVAVIDANGKTLSEYWHSGHLFHLTLADLDDDGREEIIATGVNNGYRQATLVVLDSDKAFGASTELVRPEIQIHGMEPAHERIRLIFPRSDLNKIVGTFNESLEAVVQNGKIRLAVLECHERPGCQIWYELDTNFNLLMADPDDYFRSFHREFYLNKKDDHPFSAEEAASFRQVRSITGSTAALVPVQTH